MVFLCNDLLNNKTFRIVNRFEKLIGLPANCFFKGECQVNDHLLYKYIDYEILIDRLHNKTIVDRALRINMQ